CRRLCGVKQNFMLEIEHLLEKVPTAVGEDPTIWGLMYDFLPWQGFSSIAVQALEADPHDSASWKYYEFADSDASRIRGKLTAGRRPLPCRSTTGPVSMWPSFTPFTMTGLPRFRAP